MRIMFSVIMKTVFTCGLLERNPWGLQDIFWDLIILYIAYDK